MPSPIRHHLHGLRLFWITMLLLGAVFKPVIVMACEAHEATHLLATGHGHEGDAHENGPPADEPAADTLSTPWMNLLHQGHCCVHGAALIATTIIPDAQIATIIPGTAEPARKVDIRRIPMLRPPIRG